MTREMFDACTASNIDPNAAMVAGYDDGLCKWSQADWDRFRNAIKVHISSLGTNTGQVLDVEPGNPNARYAVTWARMRRAAGVIPTIYTAEWADSKKGYGPIGYSWADCIREFDAAGEPQPNYWIAPVASGIIPAGAVAVQHTYKGTVDVNSVVDYWPGVDGGEEVALLPDERQMLERIHQTVQGGLLPLLSVIGQLPAIKSELDAIQVAINAAGGHPADVPILAAVARAQAALDAIKAKTDRDLA